MVAMCLSVYSRQHLMPLGNVLYPRRMGYSIGLLYTDAFMAIELNKLDIATICFTHCKASNVSLFYKILIHHKGESMWLSYQKYYINLFSIHCRCRCHRHHHHHHHRRERLDRQLNVEFPLHSSVLYKLF